MAEGDLDRMPDLAFRMMSAIMRLEDWLFPRIDRRIQSFGILPGMTVVDYGCGPGRYTTRFSKIVGEKGKVYAVDVQELALEKVKRKMVEQGLTNIVPVLAECYQTAIQDHVADLAFVLDMIFGVRHPTRLLSEVQRIVKEDGMLILDDGHQPRQKTLHMLQQSGRWEIVSQSKDHLTCRPAETAGR